MKLIPFIKDDSDTTNNTIEFFRDIYLLSTGDIRAYFDKYAGEDLKIIEGFRKARELEESNDFIKKCDDTLRDWWKDGMPIDNMELVGILKQFTDSVINDLGWESNTKEQVIEEVKAFKEKYTDQIEGWDKVFEAIINKPIKSKVKPTASVFFNSDSERKEIITRGLANIFENGKPDTWRFL